jgi:hypothetical protein
VPLPQRGDERERLERGTGLALTVRGQVERALVEVLAADHREHLAAAVVDGDDRGGRAEAREVVGDGLLGGLLKAVVERRLDDQAATERLAGAVLVDDLLAQPIGEVRCLRVDRGRLDVLLGRNRGVEQRLEVLVADLEDALLAHLRQHDVALRLCRFGVGPRVVGGRRRDQGGEHRRFLRSQDRRAAVAGLPAARMSGAEVGAGRRLDPVGTVTEVDVVEVVGEDLVLRPLTLDLIGERRLAKLLEDGSAALRLERVLDELLGDRRGALDRAAGKDVLLERPGDAEEVDAAVLVEALVLDRDHGLLERGGDFVRLDEDPLLVAGQGRQRRAVAGEDDRVLSGVVLSAGLEVGEVLRHGHHHPEHPGDDRQQAEAEEHEESAKLLDLRTRLTVRGRAAPPPTRAQPGEPLAEALAFGPALGPALLAEPLPLASALPSGLLGLLAGAQLGVRRAVGLLRLGRDLVARLPRRRSGGIVAVRRRSVPGGVYLILLGVVFALGHRKRRRGRAR